MINWSEAGFGHGRARVWEKPIGRSHVRVKLVHGSPYAFIGYCPLTFLNKEIMDEAENDDRSVSLLDFLQITLFMFLVPSFVTANANCETI